MQPFTPFADRVALRVITKTEQMRGSLYIPETAKDKPQVAEVVAVGPGKLTDSGVVVPCTSKVGDRVVFAKYSGTEIQLEDGTKLLVMRESDVIGLLPGFVVPAGTLDGLQTAMEPGTLMNTDDGA